MARSIHCALQSVAELEPEALPPRFPSHLPQRLALKLGSSLQRSGHCGDTTGYEGATTVQAEMLSREAPS
jgi:hypothetical protein